MLLFLLQFVFFSALSHFKRLHRFVFEMFHSKLFHLVFTVQIISKNWWQPWEYLPSKISIPSNKRLLCLVSLNGTKNDGTIRESQYFPWQQSVDVFMFQFANCCIWVSIEIDFLSLLGQYTYRKMNIRVIFLSILWQLFDDFDCYSNDAFVSHIFESKWLRNLFQHRVDLLKVQMPWPLCNHKSRTKAKFSNSMLVEW